MLQFLLHDLMHLSFDMSSNKILLNGSSQFPSVFSKVFFPSLFFLYTLNKKKSHLHEMCYKMMLTGKKHNLSIMLSLSHCLIAMIRLINLVPLGFSWVISFCVQIFSKSHGKSKSFFSSYPNIWSPEKLSHVSYRCYLYICFCPFFCYYFHNPFNVI